MSEPGRTCTREGTRVWAAGIVNHGAYEDLEKCLASLAGQSCPPRQVFVYDTQVDLARLSALRGAWPEVEIEAGPNIGFAAGANRAVKVLCQDVAIEFVLILNPDVVLDAPFAERLVDSVHGAPQVAIATGKLLRPDRETLDSAGIEFPRHRRPRDRGSETLDRGQFDRPERVEAASGAAMLLRVASLPALAIEGELFDESFFAYHEDTDLCWRARRFGFEILYEPSAVAVHARGWQREGRQRIPAPIRRHSFKNHYLQLIKNEPLGSGVKNLPWLLTWEVLRFGFVVLRDRPMLGAYIDSGRALPAALRKRRKIAERVSELGADRPRG